MTTKNRKDRKTSKLVAERDGYTCVWCGHPGCDHAHIISRRFLNTRWVVENGLYMCRKDHMLFDRNDGPGKKFRQYIIKVKIGEDVYNKLCEVRDGKAKPGDFGFTEVK